MIINLEKKLVSQFNSRLFKLETCNLLIICYSYYWQISITYIICFFFWIVILLLQKNCGVFGVLEAMKALKMFLASSRFLEHLLLEKVVIGGRGVRRAWRMRQSQLCDVQLSMVIPFCWPNWLLLTKFLVHLANFLIVFSAAFFNSII